MKYAIIAFLILIFGACSSAPTENLTSLRENAYSQGYDVGYGKGYIKGGEDARQGIEDIKANAYKEGYVKGYKDVVAEIGNMTQDNQSGLVTTIPVDTSRNFPGKYVGDKSTGLYHYPLCSNAVNILPANQAWADFTNYLKTRGMKPCPVCNPPK